jgi:transketolase
MPAHTLNHADTATGLPNQEVFARKILELARLHSEIQVVTSDSRGSGKLVPFGEALPHQLTEVGIAEQNLVGVAAGLAACGKKVFAVSPACFLTARSLEQIKNDVCYSDHPVVLVGISAGVSYGALGSTHHSIHDFAVLRALHNISILAPADNWETQAAIKFSFMADHPVFLRFGKKPVPTLHSPDRSMNDFPRGYVLREGNDLALIATGETVWRALDASDQLLSEGIHAPWMISVSLLPLGIVELSSPWRNTACMVASENAVPLFFYVIT